MEDNKNFSNGDNFEDIVSDSKTNINSHSDFEDFYSSSNSKIYKKNRRGIRKIFGIGDWWRERKSWQKAVMITATSFILIIAILLGVILTVFDYNYKDITQEPEDLGFEEVIDKEITNIALFGIDTRDKKSFKGLSDSIMILSLNSKTKTVKVISVLRDSLVPITYNGKTTYNKINSAYSKGGPELAIKTLNTNFGLDISEYATVNFYGMADIIEAVGGIDAELTEDEVISTWNYNKKHGINDMIVEVCQHMGYKSSQYSKYLIKKSGKMHLNGIQAVAYSRIRYCRNIWGTNNDFGRTDRQRYVMEQLFNKATKLKKTDYIKLAKALIPCSQTSLSYSEIMGLATSILLHSPSFEQTRVPMSDYQMQSKSIKGVGSSLYYDLNYAKKLIKAFIYDNITPEQYMEENGIEKNDWYKGPTYKPSGNNSNNTSSNNNSSGGTTSGGPSDTSSNESGSDGTDSSGTDSGGDSSSSSSDSSSSGTDGSGDNSGGDQGGTDTESNVSSGTTSDTQE